MGKWSKYTKQYNQEWEKDSKLKSWIGPVAGNVGKAFCKYCRCEIRSHRNDLISHSETEKHRRNAKPYSSTRIRALLDEKFSKSSNAIKNNEHPRTLVPKLCKLMYGLGWATGTGGGMSVRDGDYIYMAPSGVQKELISPEDLFICDISGEVLQGPVRNLKLTECAPLFLNAFTMREAGAVLHSHSKFANLVSMLYKGHEFRITCQEMLKGIKRGSSSIPYKYNDMLKVPIIENVCHERELTQRMRHAMDLYPDSNAVIVRRHGVYIWGSTWQSAKTQAECFHYLFELAIEMKKLGLDPEAVVEDEGGITDKDIFM